MAGRAAAQACGALARARAVSQGGAVGYVEGLGPGAADMRGALARARAAHQGSAWGHEPGSAPGSVAALHTPREGLAPGDAAELTAFWPMQLDVGAHSVSASPYGPAGAPALPLATYAAPRTRGSHGRRTAAGVREPAQHPSKLLPSSCESPSLSPSLHLLSAQALRLWNAPSHHT